MKREIYPLEIILDLEKELNKLLDNSIHGKQRDWLRVRDVISPLKKLNRRFNFLDPYYAWKVNNCYRWFDAEMITQQALRTVIVWKKSTGNHNIKVTLKSNICPLEESRYMFCNVLRDRIFGNSNTVIADDIQRNEDGTLCAYFFGYGLPINWFEDIELPSTLS